MYSNLTSLNLYVIHKISCSIHRSIVALFLLTRIKSGLGEHVGNTPVGFITVALLGISSRWVKLLANRNSRVVNQLKLWFCSAYIQNSRLVN